MERPHPVFRLLCALGLLTLIFAAARSLNPASSSASGPTALIDAAANRTTLVGSLKSDGYTLHVFENGFGERSFTLYGPDGAMLANHVTMDELREAAPELDASRLTVADEAAPVEPRRE